MVPVSLRAAAGSDLNYGLVAHNHTSRMVDPVGWFYTTSSKTAKGHAIILSNAKYVA